MTILHGDCLDILRQIPDSVVDAVVTDPPSGIGFMGLKWDSYSRDQFIAWLQERMVECLRVLKPGGHLLCWALPRTSHWTAMSIENAGFEIRDRVSHLFGTGFPKSRDISKDIDKAAGAERKVTGVYTTPDGRELTTYHNWQDRNIKNGTQERRLPMISSPVTDDAKKWAGWGTTLKPAMEDWWMARKPFTGSTFENVLKHEVGALNIDACRIGVDESTESGGGRWPPNVTMDEDAAGELDMVSRLADSAGVSRYFYCSKAAASEKNAGVEGKNDHPTVKPLPLMRWLCRLVTPPKGIVLDPFCGSGTTGVAAALEGFEFIGIDMNQDYVKMAEDRIAHVKPTVIVMNSKDDQGQLKLI